MCEVSIIVPVYNVEKWLPRCVESLLNQADFNNMEIILVDDGSTDSSGLICDNYSSQYENVLCIHKENGGVSSARNAGMKCAHGTYIAFADADDYVDNNFYNKLLIAGKQYNAELVIGDYYLDFPDGKIVQYRSPNLHKISLNADSALIDFMKGEYIGINLFDKLFLRESIGSLQFDEDIRIGEDLYFIFQYITRINKVYGVFVPGYYYFQREGSAMKSSFKESNFDVITVSKRIMNWVSTYKTNIIKYAEAMYIYSAYKTVERAYKSNIDLIEYRDSIRSLKKDIQKYSLFDAHKYLSRKKFVGFILIKYFPHLYMFVCKIKRI